MKTTKLPSVEDRVKTICSCRKGSMDDKQYEATVEYNLTQDRNQAYTSLIEGIEGIKFKVDTYYAEEVMVVDIEDLKKKIDTLYGKE